MTSSPDHQLVDGMLQDGPVRHVGRPHLDNREPVYLPDSFFLQERLLHHLRACDRNRFNFEEVMLLMAIYQDNPNADAVLVFAVFWYASCAYPGVFKNRRLDTIMKRTQEFIPDRSPRALGATVEWLEQQRGNYGFSARLRRQEERAAKRHQKSQKDPQPGCSTVANSRHLAPPPALGTLEHDGTSPSLELTSTRHHGDLTIDHWKESMINRALGTAPREHFEQVALTTDINNDTNTRHTLCGQQFAALTPYMPAPFFEPSGSFPGVALLGTNTGMPASPYELWLAGWSSQVQIDANNTVPMPLSNQHIETMPSYTSVESAKDTGFPPHHLQAAAPPYNSPIGMDYNFYGPTYNLQGVDAQVCDPFGSVGPFNSPADSMQATGVSSLAPVSMAYMLTPNLSPMPKAQTTFGMGNAADAMYTQSYSPTFNANTGFGYNLGTPAYSGPMLSQALEMNTPHQVHPVQVYGLQVNSSIPTCYAPDDSHDGAALMSTPYCPNGGCYLGNLEPGVILGEISGLPDMPTTAVRRTVIPIHVSEALATEQAPSSNSPFAAEGLLTSSASTTAENEIHGRS